MKLLWIPVILLSLPAFAAEEGMTAMPKIAPKKTFTVETSEQGTALQENAGFGSQEPVVRMKNLMMVGGSGAEGMDMSEQPPAAQGAGSGHAHRAPAPHDEEQTQFEIAPNPARLGTNRMTILAKDLKAGKPAARLPVRVQVSMATMDMGTEEPKVREISPGNYQFKAAFSMKGRWSIRLILPNTEKLFAIEVK